MASFISSNFQLTSNQTALALVVPEHLKSEINSLRKLHDKSYRKWQPHINLIYPFVDPSSLSSAVTVLRKFLHNEEITSVQVNIDETGVFRHQKNATVFLKPSLESEETICQLRRILVKALGCDEKDGTHDGIFRPHMTIGQAGLNGTATEKLVEQAEKLTRFGWEGKSPAVLQRENSGVMRIVAELPLESLRIENDDGDKHLSMDTGWRPCYSFTSDTGWSQPPRNTDAVILENSSLEKVTIATYNLMAGIFAPPFESRLKLIIEALSTVTASSTFSTRILCLQEVNEEMLPLILAETFIQTNFPYSTHMPSSLLPSHRNLITLASRPFKNFHLELPERHKEALIISLSEFPLKIANVHLTSALSDKAVEVKWNQMETLTNFFRDRSAAGKEILVAGDFNLTTSSHTLDTAVSLKFISPETAQLVGSVINIEFWEDAFDSTGAASTDNNPNDLFEGEEGATFDRLTNPLAAMFESPIDNRPQRYDRVIFWKGGRLHLENCNIFGRPTEQGFCGSDHYGVSVTVRINKSGQNTSKTVDSSASLLGNIKVVEDLSDVQSLIEPYLPTIQDRQHRQQALNLLHQTLTSNSNIEDLVFAPLGSYLMDTYSGNSDVDLLIIGSVPAEVFFNFASTELRSLDTRGNGEFKGIHSVNSLVSIIEVSTIGIKFDLQYCQAPELLEKYHSTNNTPNLQTLVFDTTLISSLPPSSIRPLNTYRDAAYLLNSLPDLPSYRASHRFLSLYLKRRGLYSAKFGYLGGIHLALMLNRIIKLIATNSSRENSGIESETKISPATIIRTFFAYYANFDWANDNVTDSVISDLRNVSRSTRDAIFIYSIHKPTARPNVASSCTRLTAQTLTQEFTLAT